MFQLGSIDYLIDKATISVAVEGCDLYWSLLVSGTSSSRGVLPAAIVSEELPGFEQVKSLGDLNGLVVTWKQCYVHDLERSVCSFVYGSHNDLNHATLRFSSVSRTLWSLTWKLLPMPLMCLTHL